MVAEYRVYTGKKKRATTKTLTILQRNKILESGGFVIVATEDKKHDRDKMNSASDYGIIQEYEKEDYPTLYGVGNYFNVGFDGQVRSRVKSI